MKFSICIPNYNYARYLPFTLDSVISQTNVPLEICVSDNNSDDGSQELIGKYAANEPRIKVKFHPSNVGFSDKLSAVSQMAEGDWQILLSSDDLMNHGALHFYENFITAIGSDMRFAFSSSCDLIDHNGLKIGYIGPRSKVWRLEDIDVARSKEMGCDVYRVSSKEMIKRCLASFYGFFNFASTCYPTSAFLASGGYLGGRMYGPDKWLHWRLLANIDMVFFIDTPLFSYRWHAQNQSALQQKSRALKFLVDEYRNVIEIPTALLSLASIDSETLQRNFMEEVVAKQAFSALKSNQREEARRVLRFGGATYPSLAFTSFNIWAIKSLLLLGPVGTWLAKLFKPDF